MRPRFTLLYFTLRPIHITNAARAPRSIHGTASLRALLSVPSVPAVCLPHPRNPALHMYLLPRWLSLPISGLNIARIIDCASAVHEKLLAMSSSECFAKLWSWSWTAVTVIAEAAAFTPAAGLIATALPLLLVGVLGLLPDVLR